MGGPYITILRVSLPTNTTYFKYAPLIWPKIETILVNADTVHSAALKWPLGMRLLHE